MKEDELYRWWRAKYAQQVKARLTLAIRKGSFERDELIEYLDITQSHVALALLVKYGMEFIDGLVEDLK